MGQRGRGRVAPAVAAALCAVAALPAQARAADEAGSYTFDPSAERVEGAASNTDARRLRAGGTYRDAIGPGGRLFYRLELDAKSHAYVSATAVPRPGTKVSFDDELKVTLQDRDGDACGYDTARFGSARFARPLGTYAHRTIEKDGPCQERDSYYALIERSGAAGSSSDPWELEIRHVTEPGVRPGGPTEAPEDWPSGPPAPPVTQARERRGGTSFHGATGLEQGEWRDRIRPGETLFYKVPVDWGQQLFARADVGSTAGDGYVAHALTMALYNPARGLVDRANDVSYSGRQKSTALDPLPPVAYENRFDSSDSVNGMRFAGWYYLKVSLSPEVARDFGPQALGLSLRLNVEGGEGEGAPAYAGAPGEFQVTDEDRGAAEQGRSRPVAARGDTMRLVAAGGIGAGTVLVLGLGAWTFVARRRAAAWARAAGPGPGAGAGPGQDSGAPTGYGPPASW
ncbi:hypothetical protein [Streptomyces chryseus]|uniref:Uncharacterized protein n=2 Tax=Streptomyces chryseus TaxID=68186 RepID=A0ABQ3DX02_9ACTN|nr:hypothetical protein [Streptomyces chryseus]GHB16575.1 hypothetical protein GCM10010346_45590 [Streptomyces chryseus]